jgi:hypothetical protein
LKIRREKKVETKKDASEGRPIEQHVKREAN